MINGDLPQKAQELVKEWIVKKMIIRIKEVLPKDDFILRVTFDDNKVVDYDVKEDLHLPGYGDLKTIPGLFEQVQLDQSRTCIYWNDYVDLPADMIYEYGKQVLPF